MKMRVIMPLAILLWTALCVCPLGGSHRAAGVWAQDYESLIREATAKYADGEYGQALELVRKAFEIGQPGFVDYYNAACVAALAGENDTAFDYLTGALNAGMVGKDWEQSLEDDPDLASLRSDARWENLIAALSKALGDLEASFPETRAEGKVIDLPAPRLASDVSVEATLQGRRSIRSYQEVPVTLAEVSQLLWSAYGITEPLKDGPAFLRGGLRAAPSAGGLYPLELYLVARNVTDLPPGVYWYNSETHQLVVVTEQDRWEALTEAALNQPHFQTAAAAIVYSAVFDRNTSKYGQRGRDRYVCMDLGHSAENVYLQAYALKIGTCAIGAFSDILLKKTTGMTRAEEPLYIMPFGKTE
jgi:SagB-type dehydrogenase family enzyme